jgi:hypothetical protein
MQFFAIPNDRKAVTANTVHGGLNDRQRNRCSNGRVNGIATARKNGCTGL